MVWRWFCDLSDRRDYRHGVEPENDKATSKLVWRKIARPERIGFITIEAWERANLVRLQPWQMAAITLLDDRFIEVANSPLPILAPKPGADDGGKALAEAMMRYAKPKNPKKRRK